MSLGTTICLRLRFFNSTPDSLVNKLGDSETTDRRSIENEEQKVFHVVHTHTVGNPATVVVHSDDTPAASAAMVRPGRLNTVAMLANVKELVLEVVDLVIAKIHR